MITFYAKKILALCLTLFIISALSCSKGESVEPEAEETIQPAEGSTTSSDVLPGQVAVFSLSNVPTGKDTLNAVVNGKLFTLYKIENNQFGGPVPVIPSGNYEVTIPSLQLKAPMPLKVTAYTPISNPQTVIESFELGLTRNIDSLVKINENTNGIVDVQLVQNLQAQIHDLLKDLSAAQKLELAYSIKAMDRQSGGLYGIQNVKKVTFFNPGEALVKIGESMSVAVVVAGFSILPTLSGLYMVINTPFKVYGAVVASISLTTYIIAREYAIVQARRVGDLEGIAEFILQPDIESTKTIGVNSIKATSSVTTDATNALTFERDAVKTLVLPMTFRTITTQDENHASERLRKIVADDKKMLENDKKIKNEYDKVASYFPIVGSYRLYKLQLPAVAKKAERNAPTANLTVSGISDPEIQFSVAKDEDKLKITASSQTITTKKDFTFNVTYRHDLFNTTLIKTFTATFDGNIYPTNVALVSGQDQQGQTGKKLPLPLKLKVTNKAGVAVANYKVEWAVKSGGGTLSAASSNTDVAGIAQIEWTLGDGALQKVEAVVKKADGSLLTGAPFSFTAQKEINWAPKLIGTWKMERYNKATPQFYISFLQTYNNRAPIYSSIYSHYPVGDDTIKDGSYDLITLNANFTWTSKNYHWWEGFTTNQNDSGTWSVSSSGRLEIKYGQSVFFRVGQLSEPTVGELKLTSTPSSSSYIAEWTTFK